jgi:hypothetical protein
MFNVHPDKAGNDKPQMAVLSRYARRITQSKEHAD